MKKSLLIGILALAVTGVEVQAQAQSVNMNETSSVRTESTAETLRRGGRGGGRRGGDWNRGGRGGRGGRDWDHGRRGGRRWWPGPGWRDNDNYVCQARNSRGQTFRGDGWTRSGARQEALNRCYRFSGRCWITSCYYR